MKHKLSKSFCFCCKARWGFGKLHFGISVSLKNWTERDKPLLQKVTLPQIRVKRLLASVASAAIRGQSKISNFQYFAKFFQWNQRSLGFKNGDISFHQVVENGQISPMAGWSKREDWSLLLLFAFLLS